jgi:chitin disaccharide deacetylase
MERRTHAVASSSMTVRTTSGPTTNRPTDGSPTDEPSSPSLAERLGQAADAKLVIISCDDLGTCHALNEGIYLALRDGVATCASLMVPAPWARHAAHNHQGEDLGVHLTLNAEHELYRWGPITHAPSLLSGEGGFPRTIDDLWEHADTEEVRRECRAQIERALAWGIDVTHLAPHLSSITLRPEFFDVYLELASEFRLPIRLPSSIGERSIGEREIGFPFRRLAAEEGLLFPDHFDLAWHPGSRARMLTAIEGLRPGVTEIHIQPAIDTPEVRALSPDAAGWIEDHELSLDPMIAEHLDAAGAVRIGYRALRELMRAE